MNCQVINCNHSATHTKKESHENDTNDLVLCVVTETFLCGVHADMIKETNCSGVSIDTL
jgi:hypothetical protein